MGFVIGKLKCYFCKRKGGLFHSVHKYGIYANDVAGRIFYHPECLEMVEIDPERYSHIMVDKAINIGELRKQNISKVNSNLIEWYEEKVITLHKNHFERMMPKK